MHVARETVLAKGEHAEDKVELARVGAQLVVEEDASEKGPEEAVDHGVGEARAEEDV